IGDGDQVAENALLGASMALGRGESARGAVDRLVPAVQGQESKAATDRLMGGEVGRLQRRIEQLEAHVQALARANYDLQRLQSRIANLETLVLGA
ncbi:MAG: hypothetical protein V4641_21600, partial [Pseudomonadota bacterium]